MSLLMKEYPTTYNVLFYLSLSISLPITKPQVLNTSMLKTNTENEQTFQA